MNNSPDPSTPQNGDEFVQPANAFIKFKRLKEYQPGKAWTLLYYGSSKTGKTFFAGTAGPRTLFINAGDGIETLMAPAFRQKHGNLVDEMIVVDVREHTDKATAFDEVANIIDHALANFPNEFDTVVLDEITAFRKFAISKAMELVTADRTKFRLSRMVEYVKADVQDFNVEMDMIEWFLGMYTPILKKEGKNFLVLAHERQIFGKPAKAMDEAPLKRILPGFTGKTFPDKVPAYFDDVWRSEVIGGGSNRVYRARTAGSEQELVGMRHGGVFAATESDPNFLKMLERIKQSTKR